MLSPVMLAAALAVSDSLVLEERIDLYDPVTGAFMGSERTWFGPDGRRLRLEVTDEEGQRTLLFFLLHDGDGRESEAIYFESGPTPVREVFRYSEDGRLQTTTYYYEPDVPSEKTETYLDAAGREQWKRYYRGNGEQYGEEDVLWAPDGTKIGWDFRYVDRDGGASFRYVYEAFDDRGEWVRRVRTRDGVQERVEIRTRVISTASGTFYQPVASGKFPECCPSHLREMTRRACP